MPDARWLDDDEMRAWRALVVTTVRLPYQLDSDLAAQHGLGHDDYAILVNLSEAPASQLRMTELAERVLESKSRLSHHIGRLEAEGLVRRESCPVDRRGMFAVLTAKGRKRLEQAAPDHVASVRRHFIDRLDRHQLIALADALEAVAGPLAAATLHPDACEPSNEPTAPPSVARPTMRQPPSEGSKRRARPVR